MQASEWLETKAALHNPDQIAGGKADIIGGLGDKRVNSSIGSLSDGKGMVKGKEVNETNLRNIDDFINGNNKIDEVIEDYEKYIKNILI
jgi:hypothetical protein